MNSQPEAVESHLVAADLHIGTTAAPRAITASVATVTTSPFSISYGLRNGLDTTKCLHSHPPAASTPMYTSSPRSNDCLADSGKAASTTSRNERTASRRSLRKVNIYRQKTHRRLRLIRPAHPYVFSTSRPRSLRATRSRRACRSNFPNRGLFGRTLGPR